MQYLKYLVLPIVLGIFIISCEKDDTSVVDPELHIPSIFNPTLTPQSFDTIAINAVATVQVSSADPIKQVSVTLVNPDNVGEGAFQLKDDGVSPDVSAGDGIYSGRIQFSPACMLIGSWKAEFIAETDGGLFSNTSVISFAVTNSNNHKPGMAYVIYPDSLRRPSGVGSDTVNLAFLQVKGTDPDGDCDVKDAFFNSFNPNGFANAFNPFLMFDDGNIAAHGDSVAGDKKYSLIVKITPNPNDSSIGPFTFKFNTKDRSDLLSDTLTKIINIHR